MHIYENFVKIKVTITEADNGQTNAKNEWLERKTWLEFKDNKWLELRIQRIC